MKILITGGCGFLGHHMVEHFLKASPTTEIVVVDRLSYASAGYDRLRDIAAFDDKRVRVLNWDLRQPITEGMRQELGEFDYIIHAAAETHVDNSINDPLPFFESNVIGTHNLLMYVRQLGDRRPSRVFLVSTDEVYGPAAWGAAGFDTDAPMRPANPYAASKAGGEAVGFAYANTFKLPITIVNGMNFIGERQHPEKYVPKVIKRVLSGERLEIHADSTKTRSGTRFYLHCRNFASALDFMMRQPPGTLPQKVHVVGDREVSNLDLAQMIQRIVNDDRGFEPPLHLNYQLVDFHSSRPGHDLRYAMVGTWLAEQGWTPPLTFVMSLEKTVRWYLKNPRWLHWS